ncbi:hypothetical protein MIMGU_mgv1a011938mg [Erythranthe guttata]|uniref:NAC domain-containing protein n=1 Tax=Erythranthe guttata TaxID=4155 RepID=A0A022PXQ6_ERYGU|nr:hypothetical protein MIMGU_mgv1a011938mg [Erythranthe guttata]
MKGGEQQLNLPAGFRFHPTDEELVVHYLCRKSAGQLISVPIIAEIDLYKFDPWQLPEMAHYGEKEWYFFSPRDRKYPNGSRPNRSAGTGYWKATGADKPVGKPKTLGIKKALVFYAGKAPRGLDDWVLCRIYNKKGPLEKHYNVDHEEVQYFSDVEEQKPNVDAAFAYTSVGVKSSPQILHFDTSESVPKLHNNTESSSSEHVLSPEVQSESKWNDFDSCLDYQLNYTMDVAFQDDDLFSSQMQQYNDEQQLSTYQDMFAYMHKPF